MSGGKGDGRQPEPEPELGPLPLLVGMLYGFLLGFGAGLLVAWLT